jgi:hypothetical protein
MSITHAFVNPQSDIGDSSITQPSDWNAAHQGGYSVYNVVTDYGAVGNGSTNDASAIQDAIDAAAGAGGGLVFFPPGDFLIGTTSLEFTGSYVRLIGSGRNSTTITYTGSSGAIRNSDPSTPSIRIHCGVENMSISGDGASSGFAGIQLEAMRQGVYRDLFIYSSGTGGGTTWRGLYFIGDSDAETYFNTFYNVDISLTGAAGTQWCVDMGGAGWVNRNRFFGGVWEGNNANALRIAGTSLTSDTNVFVGVGMQTHGTTIVQLGGSGGEANDNAFLGCLFELPSPSSVITFATSSGSANRNAFFGNYRSNVDFSDPDPGDSNMIFDPGRILLDNWNSSSWDAVRLRGFQSGLTIGRSDGGSGGLTLFESNDTHTPDANSAFLFAEDNGSGKTRVVIRWPDDSETVLGTAP